MDTINDNLSLTVINDNDGKQCGYSYKDRCQIFQMQTKRTKALMAYRMVLRADDWMIKRDYEGAGSIELLDQAKKVAEYYEEHVKELVA